MKATPPNSAKGSTENPSVHDFRAPKKRVIITTMNIGMMVPVIAWRPAARMATARTYSGSVAPEAANAAVNSGLTTPPWTPTKIGVPTAPNVTAVLWIIIPNITAPAAGKPMATMRGAATAAGVPNPAAPSMKDPNSQAMMTTCTRRSSLMS